jgi:hypothetical protein
MRVVPQFVDICRYDRLGEAWPAGAGIKLVGRSEQRFAGNDVDIDARLFVVVIFPRERALSTTLLGYPILRRGKLPDSFVSLCVIHCSAPLLACCPPGIGPAG